MNPPRKMPSIQKIFKTSQFRSNGLTTLNHENFARVMSESITKAINSNESSVKEKHVRKLLIGSYQIESGSFFWHYLPVIKLKENQIVCWKFCHVLHKMLRDGHRQVLTSSYERRQILLDCGNMWRHVEDGYGQLIFRYCTLLFNRINFLMRNQKFPNDLKVSDEQLDEIGERDLGVFFDLSCELFDALDDILKLQEVVISTLELKRLNSMTDNGQCLLAPLVACIQDSSLLYDYSVKILFKLHSGLPQSTLEGHRDRFLLQHKALKSFYVNASNLQYFKTLIQIAQLSERPPNFLVASDLNQHVTPQVVMISSPERDSPDQYTTQQVDNDGQLLVNFNDENPTTSDDLNANRSSTAYGSTSNDNSIDTILNHDEPLVSSSSSSQRGNNEGMMTLDTQLYASMVQDLETAMLSISRLEKAEEDAKKKRDEEMIELNSRHEQQVKSLESDLKRAKDESRELKHQINSLQKVLEQVKSDCKRAQHDNEISQGVMKKLVRDTSELKSENARLHQLSAVKPEIDPANERLIDELRARVEVLSLELNKHDNQAKEWDEERKALVSSKVQLENQLDTQQADLLLAEMDETDRIIKEATKKIEELSEKSRKIESGVKLQVNEKISEVCSNLMKAVRTLIIQSRLLQREIVGTDDKNSRVEFYKRNSGLAEGLIASANVVATAAKSLVDAADRSMSGEARFSELAAAAHEVVAAIAHLVIASRVKANKESEKLKLLTSVAQQVNQCASQVVDTANVCAKLIEQEADNVDISSLSLTQIKKLEMEAKVKVLELEDQLSKERVKLGLLRRRHYEQEDAQLAEVDTDRQQL